MSPNPQTLLQKIMEQHAKRSRDRGVWAEGGMFRAIRDVQIDNRGEVGEEFVASALSAMGYSTKRNNETDPAKKHWDVLVEDEYKLEVKTASVGSDGKSFQHENLEKDRDYHAVVLVDISPNSVYLTVAPKASLPFTRKNANWTVKPKKMHRRRKSSDYKWDLTLADVEERKIETLDDMEKMFSSVLGKPSKPPRKKK